MTPIQRASGRTAGLALLSILLTAAAFLTLGGGSAAVAHDVRTKASEPARTLAYRGLVRVHQGPCEGFFRIEGTALCTHGPDFSLPRVLGGGVALPPDLEVEDTPPPDRVRCVTDGRAGFRTQVIYARAADVSSRYGAYLDSIRRWAASADDLYHASAAEVGGSRRMRFVHDAACRPTVTNVVLDPPGADADGGADGRGDNSFAAAVTELGRLGFNRTDRKYMVFLDATPVAGVLGQGSILGDDRPGQSNANNGGPSYGVTYGSCWSDGCAPRTAAHEHMHNLGGVQMTAPHSSGGWHCVDEYDLMCYADSSNAPPIEYLCPSRSNDLFDCNHDDYYSPRRPATGYLSNHWNTAASRFLLDQPECDTLRARIAGLQAQIELDQEALSTASPAEKEFLIEQIRQAQDEIAQAEARKRAIACMS